MIEYLIFSLVVFQTILILWLVKKLTSKRKPVVNEHYTDYYRGNLVFRVFKVEDISVSIGHLPKHKIIDFGNLNQYYCWAIIED